MTRSGAADRRSHTLANRLVANPDDRATVEVTFGGFAARVHGGDVDVAVTGADTDPAVSGIPFGINSIHHVHDGEVISLGAPHTGLRSYLAVRGGIAVSTGAGVAELRRHVGDRAAATARRRRPARRAATTEDYPELDQAPVPPIDRDLIELRVVPGPRDDWFTDPDALVHTDWVATDRSDRVGMRLEGRR